MQTGGYDSSGINPGGMYTGGNMHPMAYPQQGGPPPMMGGQMPPRMGGFPPMQGLRRPHSGTKPMGFNFLGGQPLGMGNT